MTRAADRRAGPEPHAGSPRRLRRRRDRAWAPAFRILLDLPAAPELAWDRLWDLDRHTAAVPYTLVAAGEDGLGQGARLVARTSLGPFGVDDVMVVRAWNPPRTAEIEKVGRVLRGAIRVDLVAGAHGGTRLVWRQRFSVRGVPRPLAALAVPLVRAGYRAALRSIMSGVEGPRTRRRGRDRAGRRRRAIG